jgi:hypothetical protein
MLDVVRREPHLFGHQQARWTLQALLESCPWLELNTQGGLSQLLTRLGIRYKRGRSYVHSPDRHYQDKMSLIQLALLRARYDPERFVFLYQDEFGFSRQPSLSWNYEAAGSDRPLARRSYRPDTEFHGIGALNALTGQVTYRQHSHTTLHALAAFYAAIRADYPSAEVIYVAQDNWPVHFHVDVLAHLQPQVFPFPPRVPDNWPSTSSVRLSHDPLPIVLLCLPTYASWLNPIEKLWRWVRQRVLHLHRLSDDWDALKQAVLDFVAQFAFGSTDLLHYVGLLPY